MAESDSNSVKLIRQSIKNFHITAAATATNGYSDDNVSTCSTETSRHECWSKNVASRASGRRQKRRSSAAKLDATKPQSGDRVADKISSLAKDDASKNDRCIPGTGCAITASAVKPPILSRKSNKRRALVENRLEESISFEKFVGKFETIRRSKRKGRARPRTQYFAHSAFNGSLTSLYSSTSSGIDTADGSNKSTTSRNDSSNELFLKGLHHNFEDNNCEEHEDTSPSATSSTSSSIGFGDDDSEEVHIRSIESTNSSNSCSEKTKSPTAESSTSTSEFNCNDANLFIPTESPATTTTTETSTGYYSSMPEAIPNNNNYLIHVPLTYYPILLNNFNAINQQQQREISPLLSNPNVEKFYNEQREYYRRIYDKQFATCGSVVIKGKPCFLKINQDKQDNSFQDMPSIEASTSAGVGPNYHINMTASSSSANVWKRDFTTVGNGKYFGKKSFSRPNYRYANRTSYYQPHKHLGYPIRLPYTALASWQTLGLEKPYYVTYWQQLNEDNKPQMFAQIQYTSIEAKPICQLTPTNRACNELSDGTTLVAPASDEKRIPDQSSNIDLTTGSREDVNLASNESWDPAMTTADFNAPSCYNGVGNSRYNNVAGMDSIMKLGDQIMEFHQSVEQQPSTLGRKLNLRDMLYHTIAPIFPMCGLYIVGSSLNGFGNNKSDMDLCLMITNRDIDQRSDAVIVLQSIMRTLQTTSFVANQQLILAKVPILRINFHSAFSDITVDLNANNSVAIRNTHLLCYYSSFDWRVRPLVAVVKEWAKRRGINDANRSSFTSYSLVLMVIHYLQCGVVPPVLPSLQLLYPKCFNQRADVRQLNVSVPLSPPPATVWDFNDRLTLGELLIGFFQYYAFSFNFDTDAISIRLGRKTDRALVARNRSPYNHLSQWHCICIEEPFTFSNTAHSVYDERIFDSIKKSFIDGFHQLETNHDLQSFLASSASAQET